jgi:hypothetical protein
MYQSAPCVCQTVRPWIVVVVNWPSQHDVGVAFTPFGACVGLFVGVAVGDGVGAVVGACVGVFVGAVVGAVVGAGVATALGDGVGVLPALAVGEGVGVCDEGALGVFVGPSVGESVAEATAVGVAVGAAGLSAGDAEVPTVGSDEGAIVGSEIGPGPPEPLQPLTSAHEATNRNETFESSLRRARMAGKRSFACPANLPTAVRHTKS